jgi:hypothetical protein
MNFTDVVDITTRLLLCVTVIALCFYLLKAGHGTRRVFHTDLTEANKQPVATPELENTKRLAKEKTNKRAKKRQAKKNRQAKKDDNYSDAPLRSLAIFNEEKARILGAYCASPGCTDHVHSGRFCSNCMRKAKLEEVVQPSPLFPLAEEVHEKLTPDFKTKLTPDFKKTRQPSREQTEAEVNEELGKHDLSLCAVCMEEPRTILLLPCKHLLLCAKCAPAFSSECPLRCPVDTQMDVFIG